MNLEECLAGYRKWLAKETKKLRKGRPERELKEHLDKDNQCVLCKAAAYEEALKKFDSEVLSKLKEGD